MDATILKPWSTELVDHSPLVLPTSLLQATTLASTAHQAAKTALKLTALALHARATSFCLTKLTLVLAILPLQQSATVLASHVTLGLICVARAHRPARVMFAPTEPNLLVTTLVNAHPISSSTKTRHVKTVQPTVLHAQIKATHRTLLLDSA